MVRISMALFLFQPPAGSTAPPADAPPPVQRPSNMPPAEAAPVPAPTPETPPATPTPPVETPPAPATPAPVGETPFETTPTQPASLPPPVEPEPLPPPTPEGPVAAAEVEPAPPPTQTNPLSNKHREPDGPPRGPGTYFMAGGGVLMAASIAVTVVALASPSFAGQPRQRAVVVPIGLVGLSAGSALLIVGARRNIRMRRWNERAAALVPAVGPTRGGAMAGLTGRF